MPRVQSLRGAAALQLVVALVLPSIGVQLAQLAVVSAPRAQPLAGLSVPQLLVTLVPPYLDDHFPRPVAVSRARARVIGASAALPRDRKSVV